jgi:hypothetical protein
MARVSLYAGAAAVITVALTLIILDIARPSSSLFEEIKQRAATDGEGTYGLKLSANASLLDELFRLQQNGFSTVSRRDSTFVCEGMELPADGKILLRRSGYWLMGDRHSYYIEVAVSTSCSIISASGTAGQLIWF